MHDQAALAAIAIALGVVVAVALFVPFVWLSYRRAGTLSAGRSLTYVAVLVYFFAIWVFTLLPLPDPDTLQCVGRNLRITEFVDDINGAIARGHPLTDPAVLQLVFNIALFVPLGFFVRFVARRGVVVAFLIGLATSVFIECTQGTGVWGLYPCAYRVFDVDDMLTNTTGAVLGSLLALPWHRRRLDPGIVHEPRPVTRGRRLIGMVCDLLTAAIATVVLSVGTQVVLRYVVHDERAVLSGDLAGQVGDWGTLGLTVALVLVTGRTVGDYAVEIRFGEPGILQRLIRFFGGVGGFLVLQLLPHGVPLSAVFAVICLVWMWRGDHSGLPGLGGHRVRDARSVHRDSDVPPH